MLYVFVVLVWLQCEEINMELDPTCGKLVEHEMNEYEYLDPCVKVIDLELQTQYQCCGSFVSKLICQS
jgi:hypothetical protein